MNMRHTILGLAAGVTLGLSGVASALELQAGDFKIIFDNYDSGTTGYNDGTPGVTTVCTTVAGCDGVAGIIPAEEGIGSEDTWGIFSIASITSISGGDILFSRGADGYLIGMFYGLEDTEVSIVNGGGFNQTQAVATGGSLVVYESATDYDPTGGAAARTGLSTYPSIGGSLWLSADFAPGAIGTAPAGTYVSNFNSTTFGGNGQGFLDVTGGSAAAMLDSNSLQTTIGTYADLFLTATFDDVNGVASDIGWLVKSSGQVSGKALPAPGTLALMGLALAGLGFSRRRQRRS